MYNRYIPSCPTPRTPPPAPPPQSGGFLQSLLGRFKGIDKGDLMLMLILVLLCMEDGEETDMLIVVAMVFLLGL